VRALARLALVGILVLVAVNAVGGGVYGLLGAEGVPAAWLEGSPFRSYVVPSLVLLVAVGGSHAAAAVLVHRRASGARRAAVAAGAILLVFIAVELATIGCVSWLQPTMALAAVATVLLARAQS
jgi:hypothetical protein